MKGSRVDRKWSIVSLVDRSTHDNRVFRTGSERLSKYEARHGSDNSNPFRGEMSFSGANVAQREVLGRWPEIRTEKGNNEYNTLD